MLTLSRPAGQGHEASRKLQSFAKEVSIMSEYRRCDNLLRLHGACLRRPHVAIVYELMAGNLHDRIYSPFQEPMELLKALSIAWAVASGLDELHPNVVHRDLKVILSYASLGLSSPMSCCSGANACDIHHPW